MLNLTDHLRATHRFLSQRAFYPLVLSSALGCAILVARMRLSHSPAYVFLIIEASGRNDPVEPPPEELRVPIFFISIRE